MNEPNFAAEFTAAFGELTPAQLWTLTKFTKRVRKFARNNSAFNNLANRAFPYAQFRQVNKTRISKYTGQPETYPGLQITVKGQSVEEESED